MIPFNKPPVTGKELKYINEIINLNNKFSGDGKYTKCCNEWFEHTFKTPKALLTTSCTHALEMAAMLIDIKPGDEVIAPSYTFVSTVNAFVLRGAKIIFVDIRPDTMNIDENLIEAAITDKTKAIIPVHYAGIACEMDVIMSLADKYGIYVIEDAAQGVMSTYKGKALGTIGDIGCFSFHDTKNYTMGEGGAILIQNEKFFERAEIIREKGTNRSKFVRGQIDKYTWVDLGSSYLPSELNAAFLFAQLQVANKINDDRLRSWHIYYEGLQELETKNLIELPTIPKSCEHNAHMFYIKCRDINQRAELIEYLKSKSIQTAFHYIPLHSAAAGSKFGVFLNEDSYTTSHSERLLRLPMYYNISETDILEVVLSIKEFFINKISID
ncbi:dTDP-4-amino-4,6-dideoxygalactose transaminase [Amphibacillus cookii]|uniref:dTDP-4-amino-4,6-dideoxygalactose transaminase n=1 Tax=Amphibacillus cookii TaxID=767787 RepID=UPI001959E70C|nr:dTDP-4-amino-4,6-dideoxygalactose transaminase [Amphibacillus cookii]MBM7539784.1 dTDP-4-amino-4,6-dideoxygalactose transaminase [Amphibacillus cookii]